MVRFKIAGKKKVATWWKESVQTGGSSKWAAPGKTDYDIISIIGNEFVESVLEASSISWLSK